MSSSGSIRPAEVAVLLVDISGSTPLYERLGDAAAAGHIGECLDRLRSIAGRAGGTFIRSRGDDVLCAFTEPAAALEAARAMMFGQLYGPLTVHAGGHFGQVIWAHDDLLGDAVNLTARLAGLAQPGELLVSRHFLEWLPEKENRSFRLLDNLAFKGRDAPAEVFTLLRDDGTTHTEILSGSIAGIAASQPVLLLRYRKRVHQCSKQQILSIGRSTDCDVVIAQPWISRVHVTVTVRRDKVHLEDRSSSGTYVTIGRGQELFIHRESMLLAGSGLISPAMRAGEAAAEILRYEILPVAPHKL